MTSLALTLDVSECCSPRLSWQDTSIFCDIFEPRNAYRVIDACVNSTGAGWSYPESYLFTIINIDLNVGGDDARIISPNIQVNVTL